jgi:hypothetical protein
MLPDGIENLTRRIARLERENRRLKMVGIVAAVVFAAFTFAGAGKTPRTIEAEKIVLLDSHGRARLTIGTPAIAGATIDAAPDEPVVWLTDDKGTDRAMLMADGLFFANSKSKPTVSLSSDVRPGRSGLRFYGSDGKAARAELTVDSIFYYAQDGMEQMTLDADHLAFFDPAQPAGTSARVFLQVLKGEPTIWLSNRQGKVIWSAP